jgi:hypothetical protein
MPMAALWRPESGTIVTLQGPHFLEVRRPRPAKGRVAGGGRAKVGDRSQRSAGYELQFAFTTGCGSANYAKPSQAADRSS